MRLSTRVHAEGGILARSVAALRALRAGANPARDFRFGWNGVNCVDAGGYRTMWGDVVHGQPVFTADPSLNDGRGAALREGFIDSWGLVAKGYGHDEAYGRGFGIVCGGD